MGFLIRPTNLIILVFLPFLTESRSHWWKNLIDVFLKNWKSTGIGILLFLCLVSTQFLNVYYQTGHIALSIYTDEGFTNWRSPFMWKSLFGFEKGMFIYSPVLLLLFPGAYVAIRKRCFMGIGVILFFMVSLYVTSSWWCWSYGGALGLRALVDYYPIYALLIVMFLDTAVNLVRALLVFPVVLALMIYQLYEWQYRNSILDSLEMNWPKYKLIFGKTQFNYAFITVRKIDTLRNFRFLNAESGMIDYNSHKRISVFHFQKQPLEELPYTLVIPSAETKSLTGNFVCRVRADFRLESDSSYSAIWTHGYSGAKEVFAYENTTVHKIEKIGQWQTIHLDIRPFYPLKNLDSVKVVYSYGANPSSVRKPTVFWGTEP